MADQPPPARVEQSHPEAATIPRRLEDATTIEQVARAIFAAAKPPDPSKRQPQSRRARR